MYWVHHTKDEAEYKDAPLTPPSHLKIDDVTEDTVTLSWGRVGAKLMTFILMEHGKAARENSVTGCFMELWRETYTFKVGAQKRKWSFGSIRQ